MEKSANEVYQEETAVKADPVNGVSTQGNGNGDNDNNNNKPETDKKDQAAEKETEKKTRSSTKRKLASDKNILKKKKNKLENIKEKIKNLKAIRKRGYERKEMDDGKIKLNFLSKQEITWYSIKIDNMEKEKLDLEEEIEILSESFGKRLQNTRNASRGRVIGIRKEKRAKARAKKILKESEKEIISAAKNGDAEKLRAVVVAYKEDNKKDEAFKSLEEFFAEDMTPLHKELMKDPAVKAEFMISAMKLLCTELQGQN